MESILKIGERTLSTNAPAAIVLSHRSYYGRGQLSAKPSAPFARVTPLEPLPKDSATLRQRFSSAKMRGLFQLMKIQPLVLVSVC